MSDICTVRTRLNGADLEYVDKASGNVPFKFFNAYSSAVGVGAANALTAHAGGGQGSALALTAQISRFTTVATAADSALLPPAVAGMFLVVTNAAASNSMTVYPTSGEVINALSANTGLAVAANKTILFFCAVAGTWNSLLTA